MVAAGLGWAGVAGWTRPRLPLSRSDCLFSQIVSFLDFTDGCHSPLRTLRRPYYADVPCRALCYVRDHHEAFLKPNVTFGITKKEARKRDASEAEEAAGRNAGRIADDVSIAAAFSLSI